jgi:hypothetical protein
MENIPKIISNSLTFLKIAVSLDDNSLNHIATALDKNTSITEISVTTNAIQNEKM